MTAAHDVHTTKAPLISLEAAQALLRERFGIDGECTELPSERDRNVQAQCADGSYVLKISNSAESADVVAMEVAAMEHVAQADPGLPIPRVVQDLDGAAITQIDADDGRRHLARVVSVLPGQPIEGQAVPLALATEIGAATGRTSAALAGFFHPAGGRTHVWDIRRVRDLARHAEHIAEPGQRTLVERALSRIASTLDGVWILPGQIEHADVTLTNVLVEDARRVTGVIDFGDMHHTASVCDLASSLNSVLRGSADQGWDCVRETAAAYLEGYLGYRSLSYEEGQAVADLILARLCASLLISAWRAGDHPENLEYIAQYDAASWGLLGLLLEQRDLTQSLARLCGTSRASAPAGFDRTLRSRRDAVVAGSFMPLMYDDPIQLSHGRGAWLIDTDGRPHLDGYNNVPVVGHANQVVRQAINHQLRFLNTNARYVHGHGVELAERLLATMPADLGFDTCILANSGSEAVDLAWRLATSYTRHGGAVIGDSAYHGITAATEPFSSNEWPPGYHPDHVATFDAPYDVGGRAPGQIEASARVDRAMARLEERGHRPALLMADPMFTSAGILDAQPEFMAALGETARRHGALVLADEVQSGFGRTGPAMWAFVEGGLRPDLVTLGKPMGNGHPVAAVITRREVAEAMAQRYQYFSTFAGSPVSAIAALTTLDVLEDRGLAQAAVRTGDYLRSELALLAASVTWISQVRGRGLLAGVEIRSDSPDSTLTATALAEGLRQQQVLVGVTGRHRDVLKVRPPLIWDASHVDHLVDAVRRVGATIESAHR